MIERMFLKINSTPRKRKLDYLCKNICELLTFLQVTHINKKQLRKFLIFEIITKMDIILYGEYNN